MYFIKIDWSCSYVCMFICSHTVLNLKILNDIPKRIRTYTMSNTPILPSASFIIGAADRSGSMRSFGMSGVAPQFYEQMLELHKVANDTGVPTYFTIASFDNNFEIFIDTLYLNNKTTAQLPSLEDFVSGLSPRGLTRLYDSALECLDLLTNQREHYYKRLPLAVRRLDPTITTSFVLLTDGYDNYSTPDSQEKLKLELSVRKKDPNFTNIFLGANIDAPSVGKMMGFNEKNIIQMNSTPMSADVSIRSVSKTLTRTITGTAVCSP